MYGRDDHRWTVAAVGVIAVLGVVDLALGPDVQFTGSVVIAPFLAAAMVGPRPTLLVGALALGTVVFLSMFNDEGALESTLRLLVVIAGGGLAAWLADRRVRRERELAQVTRVAEVAQRCVLTPVPPRAGAVAFASRYLSATPEALIGGDFYEVIECDGPVRAVVGDVRGKGLDAVRLAAVVLGSFREAAQSPATLEEVATLVDRRLRRHLDAEDFVTAVFAEFGPDGDLTLVNCGHHPPLLVRPTAIELLMPATSTTPLGLDPQPVAYGTPMLAGDRLLLYTDGLVEARSHSGRMIALDRLADTLRSEDLDDALGALVDTLQALVVGALEDDMALLLAEFCGPGVPENADDTRILSVTADQ
ncbi:MAG: PP2C family protein-serine/threonine phosphatase [Acidimicrobiales bacterium]